MRIKKSVAAKMLGINNYRLNKVCDALGIPKDRFGVHVIEEGDIEVMRGHLGKYMKKPTPSSIKALNNKKKRDAQKEK